MSKIISKSAALFAACLFALSCSGSEESDSPKPGDDGASQKSECIRRELAIGANTLDDVRAACENATRGEVLSMMENTIGSCNKNDLDFDKTLNSIKQECNASSSSAASGSYSSSSATIAAPSSSSYAILPSSSSMNSSSGSSGTGGSYENVTIGTQVWMKKNLDIEVDGSKCYDYLQSNCEKYGRLYTWEAAMSACPAGWHLPSREDWIELSSFVESDKSCSDCDAKYLKAMSGWNRTSGNGTDAYGFGALPGGGCYSLMGNFEYAGTDGNWWSSSEDSEYTFASYSYVMSMYYQMGDSFWKSEDNSNFFSVRCLHD